ncbi:MAG: hypothetical protein ACXAEF_09570 [Candidatus Thorarchaeota archaeon]|jgi:DNA repair exonuclease SbcCD ATPase subunit
MSDEKLSEEDKAAMQKALKDAALSDLEIKKLAEGEDEFGETTLPVDSGDDLVSAAADALEFVDALDGSEVKPDRVVGTAESVASFDNLLKQLEAMRSDIAALQRSVVGIFAAQLLTFRGKVVDLKSIVSEEMVEKLRMPMFKGVIETTFVDIVDGEFAALEKELVDKIVDQTQERFKEFATRVRDSETELRTAIIQQQDVVRSFMQSLEEEALASGEGLGAKDKEVRTLEKKIKELQSQLDSTRATDAQTTELNRRITELEAEIDEISENLTRKDAALTTRTTERDEARAEANEVKIQVAELQTEMDVYKKQEATASKQTSANESEMKSLQSKVELLEKTLAEKREESKEESKQLKDLERRVREAEKDKAAAEESADSRLKELESMQDKINEVKELEQKIYDLENSLKEAEEKVPVVEMQKEAFEKATRLMEKERDMALEMRDLADERAKRYITVLGLEANTKVLLLVDEVGRMSFTDLGKSLGIPKGLATKHARELEKLGVLKVEGEVAISTLKEIEIKEGEVKVD